MESQSKRKNEEALSGNEDMLKKILQMSGQELKNYIDQMALENPLLDVDRAYAPVTKANDIKRKLDWLNQVDESNRVYTRQESEEFKNQDAWDIDRGIQDEDLTTYLQAQVTVHQIGEKEYEVLSYMIESLDSKGYMKEDLKEIAERFEVPKEEVEQVLKALQGLEPAGIGARDLKECLTLQLERAETDESLTIQIVSDYLELIGTDQVDVIAQKMGITPEKVKECEKKIKKLNPKPGNGFASREKLAYLVPDVTVVKLAGYYEILLNEYLYPEICVNSYYENLLKEGKEECGEEVKAYIQTKADQVYKLMACIEQRSKILLQVTNAIVNMQSAFFFSGRGLKPLKIQEISEKTEVDESVIRRVVRGKYLQCMWGVYPIRYFFLMI